MGLSLISTQSGDRKGQESEQLPPLAGEPRRFGDYELLEEIARGGMGVVYRARQVSLNRIVAVKVLLFGRFASDAFVKRFRAEAEAAASLRHPNIVAIHEVGEQDGQHYFSMEFVEGRSLHALVRDKPLSARQAARYLKSIAEAVEYAHCHGVLHRDLKPSNVLIDAGDQPRITDFGLAKRLTADSELTITGQVLGSPNFMPPEQAEPRRGAAGPASDVYSLGAILYHLLTGRPPFVAETFEGTLAQLLHREPISPRLLNPGVPRDLETICLKCLEKDPARRYAAAGQLMEELERFLNDEPIVARPVGPAGWLVRWARRKPAIAGLLGGLVIVLLAGVFGITWQWRRAEANATDARHEAERAGDAESDAKEKLWRSLVEQARAERRSGEQGQRNRALEAVTRAAALRPSVELRNEAIAALTLPDLRFVPLWTNPYPVFLTIFGPSLTRFAAASTNGRLTLFRAEDAREEMTFPPVGRLAAQRFHFSPDERYLAATYSTGSNVVWDTATQKPVLRWGPSQLHGEFTPDSQRLLAAEDSGLLRCVSLRDGRELWQRQASPRLWGWRVQPQQKYFAMLWDGERNVEVRDLDSGELVRTLTHPSPLGTLAWSPDGKRLVVGVENGWMYAWDMDSEAGPESWKAHDDAVVALDFAPAGDWLASGSWDHSIRLWTWPARSLAVRARGYELWSSHFSSNAQWLAGVARRPVLGKFEVSTSVGFRRFPVPLGERRGAWSLDVSPDGKLVAASYTDGVRLMDLASGQPCGFQSIAECRSVIFTPDGRALITCDEAVLARWPIERVTVGSQTNEVSFGPRESIRDRLQFSQAALSGDGRWVAGADRANSRVAVYEVNNPTNRFTLAPHRDAGFVAISPDGRWVASGTWKGTGVKIWKLVTRSLVHELPVQGSAMVTFSPDSRLLVSGSGRYQVWEVGSWRELYRTSESGATVQASAFSPDSRILATTRERRVVQLLEADTGRVLAELEAPGAVHISWLRFTPDGASLLALEWTRGIQVWDLRRLRTELTALNLDWHAPPYPPEEQASLAQ
jgi:eukaryotic-like serine/threonine-protein kinase